MFETAIVRPPAPTFSQGLTTAALGAPDLERALTQHRAYVEALEGCGLRVVVLEPDPAYPDSTFIEDTAVVSSGAVILTRPGAPSRRGEVPGMRRALEPLGLRLRDIVPPGLLDGGDVCDAGDRTFIGLSQRTNLAGARQLAALLAESGGSATIVDIRPYSGVLHLKSAIAWLGGRRLIAAPPLVGHRAFAEHEVMPVDPDESLGGNSVLVNGSVLIPAGCAKLEARLRGLGLPVIVLDVSEFQKMDGGLSCLSLRVPPAVDQSPRMNVPASSSA